WETVMFLYGSALKKVTLNMEILNDEFRYLHNYNPIEHIKSRLKEPESIVKKLKRHGYESTIENMVKYVKDIAGVRIICSFTSDIYLLADMIAKSNDVKVLEIRDYIRNPKPSGYTSYHMIVSTPINMGDRKVDTVVEIQIRTVAMDFWASLEHKIQYKFEGEGNTPVYISNDLRDCARIVADLDARMLALNQAIQEIEA
ncbi:MAG: GTP pyrophosphokinase family protein, partial [Lachnospiraceae bacterium]|nr:GTP pyrophosphokinase family protein [Lachnospiraceae bacterium]